MVFRPDGTYDEDYDEQQDPNYKPQFIEATVEKVKERLGDDFLFWKGKNWEKKSASFFDALRIDPEPNKRKKLFDDLKKEGFWAKEKKKNIVDLRKNNPWILQEMRLRREKTTDPTS